MAAGVATPADLEEVRRRLRDDSEFFIDEARAAQIVTKAGVTVTMELKPPQRRLLRALAAQRAAGQPMRAIILKARQIGMSTVAQVVLMQRAAQTANHLALTVGQDRTTTAALFGIGRYVWAHLPPEIRPPGAYEGGTVDRKYLQFGEPSLQMRRQGILGLNSSYETSTAKAAAAGRGRTIHSLHLSEVAFYPSDEMLLGIVNGVPDTPDSLILKESTAQGHNHFKDDWDAAEAGESGYYAMFSPWFEENDYRRPFATAIDLEEFEKSIGEGPYGEDEPMLATLIRERLAEWAEESPPDYPAETMSDAAVRRRVLEHLHWRRWCIPAKTRSSVQKFRQEYPSTAEEAFLSSGRKVFDPTHVRQAFRLVEKSDPAAPTTQRPAPPTGALRGEDWHEIRARRHVVVEVPRSVRWVPRRDVSREERALWRLWGAPQKQLRRDDGTVQPLGQYIVTVDSAGGEEDEQGTAHDWHAITVIDHRTRQQIAEYRSQVLPHELTLQAYLAALYFNRALVVVERTGGYGLAVVRALAMDYKYPFVYEEASRDKRVEDRSDRLGFSTDHVSKPLIEDVAIRLLAEGTHGIQSRQVLLEMLSYVRNKRGRTGAEPGKHDDLLMSWMIGQFVAGARPLRRERTQDGVRKPSAGGRTFRSTKAGW